MSSIQFIFILLLVLCYIPLANIAQESIIVSESDTLGSNPDFELLTAAFEGDTLKIKSLIKKGANVNCRSENEEVTPLMFAAQNGYIESVKILLHSGADVNVLPRNHVSALLGACITGHIFIADTLILNGADVNTCNTDGVTPLMIAATYNDSVMADMLIFYGADPELNDGQGNTALHYSTYYGSSGVAELLVTKDANTNATDSHGFTPLMIAAEMGISYLADLYLKYGAKVNMANECNMTALSYAIAGNNTETAELLLRHGADPNHQIADKYNLYSLAQEFAGAEMQQLLISNGAQISVSPFINRVIIGMDLNANMDDFLAGGHINLVNLKSGFDCEAGYKTRIWVRSVLHEIYPGTFYQFWEKRSVLYAGLNKTFNVFNKSVKSRSGIFGGLNIAYSWGSFRGSIKNPRDSFHLIPKVGFFYSSRSADLRINYEYMRLPESKASPHRVNLSFGFNINTSKNKIGLKEKPLW